MIQAKKRIGGKNKSFDEKKLYKLDEYVGAQTCAECHQESHEKWMESHHYHAMELPTEETVRADFITRHSKIMV